MKKQPFIVTHKDFSTGKKMYYAAMGTIEEISGVVVGFRLTTECANPKWIATHIPSGLRICKGKDKYAGFETQERCRAYVKRLMPEIRERLTSDTVKTEIRTLADFVRKHPNWESTMRYIG